MCFVVCKYYLADSKFLFFSKENGKIPGWTEVKAIAEDNLSDVQIMISVFGRDENDVVKLENDGLIIPVHVFSLFSHNFFSLYLRFVKTWGCEVHA